MKNLTKVSITASLFFLTAGCANVTPPPNRINWDDVDPNTHCTTDETATNGQFVGGLVLAGVGGWDIGAGLALGVFPVVGLGLATAGIMTGADVDKKKAQIQQCKEFKQYVLTKKSLKKQNQGSKDESVEARLSKLDKMLAEKLISASEYEQARSKILNDL